MPNPVSRFLTFVVGGRLAQFLFLVHLVLVIYAVYPLPLANSDSWGSGGGCHGVPIAGRVLFYCDATGLLGIIATLDLVRPIRILRNPVPINRTPFLVGSGNWLPGIFVDRCNCAAHRYVFSVDAHWCLPRTIAAAPCSKCSCMIQRRHRTQPCS